MRSTDARVNTTSCGLKESFSTLSWASSSWSLSAPVPPSWITWKWTGISTRVTAAASMPFARAVRRCARTRSRWNSLSSGVAQRRPPRTNASWLSNSRSPITSFAMTLLRLGRIVPEMLAAGPSPPRHPRTTSLPEPWLLRYPERPGRDRTPMTPR